MVRYFEIAQNLYFELHVKMISTSSKLLGSAALESAWKDNFSTERCMGLFPKKGQSLKNNNSAPLGPHQDYSGQNMDNVIE